jgi:glycosyltransferase involved in cell wall biosynthesis
LENALNLEFIHKKPKIIIACTGLGHVNRGSESHIRECFDILKENEYFQLYLLKGAGPSKSNEKNIYCFKRKSKINLSLSKLLNRSKIQIEHLSFFLFSIPQIISVCPQIIYTPNYYLSLYYFSLRNLLNLKYKIILIQSGFDLPSFEKLDFVHQLLNTNKSRLILKGFPEERQIVIPHGFHVSIFSHSLDKLKFKKRYNLPTDKLIILSVGVLNASEKRFDYLISEMKCSVCSNLFLFGVGDFDDETSSIIEQAERQLGNQNFKFLSLSSDEMPEVYACADVICQPSMGEGFGKVYVEALLSGIPLICHDFTVSREVLENNAIYGDLSKQGELAYLLNNMEGLISNHNIDEGRNFAISKYEWDNLKEKYLDMFKYFYLK